LPKAHAHPQAALEAATGDLLLGGSVKTEGFGDGSFKAIGNY